MTLRLVFRLLALSGPVVLGTCELAVAADSCFECHKALDDRASALFQNDVHRRRGITCAGCHGGDASSEEMDRAMAPSAGFRGVPAGDGISGICAGCHEDAESMARYRATGPSGQLGQLNGSVHGKPAVSGKGRFVQCTSCHGAHGITPVNDRSSPVSPRNVVSLCSQCHSNATFMRSYNPSLPVDQLEKYRTSVHGRLHARGDEVVATCVSCHGSHGILGAQDVRSSVYPTRLPATCASCHSDTLLMRPYGIPTNQFAEYSRDIHGVALLKRGDLGAPACNRCHGNHGATPPGVESISKVCGSCHALNAELFSGSPHKRAFDERDLPECETCHGNHAIVAASHELLGHDAGTVCSRCHTENENAAGYGVAQRMKTLVDSLDRNERLARELVEEAEQKGMEIAEAKFRLRDARQARLETRTVVHAFDEERFREVTAKGLAVSAGVIAEAREAIDEYTTRRIGLGVATLVMSVLAISLYTYIKRLERPAGRGNPRSP